MANDTPEAALRRNMLRIRTEGLDAATEAAITVLRDPKAPAQAKSATINAIYRANGLFGNREADEDDAEPHEMTGAQLERAAARALRDLEEAGEEASGGSEEEADPFA